MTSDQRGPGLRDRQPHRRHRCIPIPGGLGAQWPHQRSPANMSGPPARGGTPASRASSFPSASRSTLREPKTQPTTSSPRPSSIGGKLATQRVKLWVEYKAGSDTVSLILSSSPSFAQGGQLVVNASAPKGITDASGVYLAGGLLHQSGVDPVFVIHPGGLVTGG